MIDSALEKTFESIGTYIVPVCIHILSYDNNIKNDFSIVFFFKIFFYTVQTIITILYMRYLKHNRVKSGILKLH